MLECVPNVSEGRRPDVVDRLASACGSPLLDVHADPDHNRSVFTLAADPPAEVERATVQLAEAVGQYIDASWRKGVHPRLGALDVVPFVALSGTPEARASAVRTAHYFAGWLADAMDVPTFLYGEADPEERPLPRLRRDAFVRRAPDYGPAEPHPRLGATAVGARPVLVAVNCELDRDDVDLARRIAHDVRESGGGLRGVRALGFELDSRRRAQVSLNLTDLDSTGLEEACAEVARHARAEGADLDRIELVGLLPRAALDDCGPSFRRRAHLDDGQTIEARLEERCR
ncbi:MAG TPA: glutamate formiminotransferase [Acidimicrobiia bacterium]|nr:glutamate formiminotransferase [Acidimicrobiia bacterium]